MRLLDLVELREAARESILKALPLCDVERDRDWMVDLLGALAKEGDERAWDAVRDLAVSGNEEAQDALAQTGNAGLAWVADNVLPTLAEDDRYRVGFWLPDQ